LATASSGSGHGADVDLDTIELGGLRQHVLVRQQQPDAPVMLFLHGGPGMPAIPYFEQVDSSGGLEANFTMVYWDQRGAGYSYAPDICPKSMTIDQFVSDTIELTQYLRQRFAVDKIYVMGHSWGTIVGSHAVARRPDLFHAYIAVAQVVNMQQNELLSYRFALAAAERTANRRALRDLHKIGEPPYENYRQMVIERRWARKFSKQLLNANASPTEPEPATELSELVRELPAWLPGPYFSMQHLWNELLRVNLFQDLPQLPVPVVFVAGRHDYDAPSILAKAYYEQVEAPQGKALVWFENSAHTPFSDEPDKFCAVVADLGRRLGHLPAEFDRKTYLADLKQSPSIGLGAASHTR